MENVTKSFQRDPARACWIFISFSQSLSVSHSRRIVARACIIRCKHVQMRTRRFKHRPRSAPRKKYKKTERERAERARERRRERRKHSDVQRYSGRVGEMGRAAPVESRRYFSRYELVGTYSRRISRVGLGRLYPHEGGSSSSGRGRRWGARASARPMRHRGCFM